MGKIKEIKEKSQIDVDSKYLDLIDKILKQIVPTKEVWAFGSRVNWTAGKQSDLDLAVFDATPSKIQELKEAFDESDLLFRVDVIDWNQIPDSFRENIQKKYVVLQEKMNLFGWRETSLSEVVKSANTGLDAVKRAPIVDFDSGIKCLRIQDVSQSKKYAEWGFTLVSETNFQKFKLMKDDILIARTGATVGVNLIVKENLQSVFNNGLIRLRSNENTTNPIYLYWNLRTEFYNSYIESISGGTSTQPNIQINVLLNFPILLPPLPEQKAIASVLSSLDDKIDLLHRQNKTLEAMAETLFRKWFVEDAAESWGVGKLTDEFEIVMGQSPPGESYNEIGNGIPMYQGNADFEFRFPKRRVYTTDPRRFAQKFDTLISVRAPVGTQNMADERCCIGRGVAAIRYRNNLPYYTYSYFKIRFLMGEIAEFNHTGTVFGSIGKDDLENIKTTVPFIEDVAIIDALLKPINDKINSNSFQIRTLEKLRNTLLPKLISGEVRVAL